MDATPWMTSDSAMPVAQILSWDGFGSQEGESRRRHESAEKGSVME